MIATKRRVKVFNEEYRYSELHAHLRETTCFVGICQIHTMLAIQSNIIYKQGFLCMCDKLLAYCSRSGMHGNVRF